MNKALLDHLDRSNNGDGPLIGAMLGALAGPIVILVIAVAAIVAASRWHRWLGILLCIPPFLGVLSTFYDLVRANITMRSGQEKYPRRVANAFVAVKALQFGLFAIAAIFLYWSVIHYS
jgi:hypothetical protein